MSGGFGKGSGIAVWKLPEELEKSSFRHRVVAVDMQLKMVHDFKHASFVLGQVRRSKVAIDKPVFEIMLSTASVEIQKSQFEMGITPESAVTEEFQYPLHRRTTFFNADLIGKLHTSLHDNTLGVEHRNGFEIYWRIYPMTDAVPKHVEFHMTNELATSSKRFGGKVTNLKSFCSLRLLLKNKC